MMRRLTRGVFATGMAAMASLSIVVTGAVTAPQPAQAAQDEVLTANGQPSWQTNAAVWAMGYADGAIYAAGDFTSVRPAGSAAGSGERARQYMAAFDSDTGDLLPFSHSFDRRPRVIVGSPDGSTVYVGGDFTNVDGQSRPYAAAFDTATGELLDWSPQPGASVQSMAVSADGSTVYLGGMFGRVAGVPRAHLAAVSADTAALTSWAPRANGSMTAMAISPDGATVYVTGYFTSLNNDASYRSVGALSASTGELLPFAAAAAMPPITSSCRSIAKDVVTTGNAAYFAAEGTGSGCFDGTFAASTSSGGLIWKNTCLGATQAVEVVGSWLYKGSHAHDCASQNPSGDPDAFPQVPSGGARKLLAERLDNGFLGPWYPNTNGGTGTALGPRAMATDGTNLWVGGQFTTVNGAGQQGLVRFSPSPETTRPQKSPAPTAELQSDGSVKVTGSAAWDRDDTDVTVRLYRDNEASPVAESDVVHSLFWRQSSVTLYDADPPAGAHTYRVQTVAASNGLAGPKSDPSGSVTTP